MYLFANKQTITSVISDDKTIIYLMFQKVTKTLLYTVLPRLLMEMRAGNPASAVILLPGRECRLGPSRQAAPCSCSHKAAFGGLGLSENTMKSVSHSRPSLRTLCLCSLRGLPIQGPVGASGTQALPLGRIKIWNSDCPWLCLSHFLPLIHHVSLDKYINFSKACFPFLQNKNSIASLVDIIWMPI